MEDSSSKVSSEDVCKELKKEMHNSRGFFNLLCSRTRVVKGRSITYSKGIIPFIDTITACISRNATKFEIEVDKILREAKK